MPDAQRRKAHVVSSFSDIGTGANFVKGASPLLDQGTFENYKAAGLITDPPTTPAAPKKRKSSRSSSSKGTAPAKAPTAPAKPAASSTKEAAPGA